MLQKLFMGDDGEDKHFDGKILIVPIAKRPDGDEGGLQAMLRGSPADAVFFFLVQSLQQLPWLLKGLVFSFMVFKAVQSASRG